MFKGLRAKIESEQRGQAGSISNNNSKQSISQSQRLTDSQSDIGNRIPIKNDTSEPSKHPPSSNSQEILELSRSDLVNRASTQDQANVSTTNDQQGPLHAITTNHLEDHAREQDTDDIDHLKGRISSLENQLNTVISEKEEINDQNAQLYQLIEKLRRNLETESETRSSLQARLSDLNKKLNDKVESGAHKDKNDVALNKSFNPDATASDPNIPHDIQALRNEVTELQAQLAKKNRQLKICQQNLTDLKKTLQKEILDHSNAQKELLKIQEQLKTPDQKSARNQKNQGKDKSTTTTQNGSNN